MTMTHHARLNLIMVATIGSLLLFLYFKPQSQGNPEYSIASNSAGTVLRGNHIHDIYSSAYGGWGLYTDEGSSEILMENNICYNCKTGAFHQHYGRDNTIRNNIFAFSSHTPDIIRSRQEEHSSFTIERNIVLTSHGRSGFKRWLLGSVAEKLVRDAPCPVMLVRSELEDNKA